MKKLLIFLLIISLLSVASLGASSVTDLGSRSWEIAGLRGADNQAAKVMIAKRGDEVASPDALFALAFSGTILLLSLFFVGGKLKSMNSSYAFALSTTRFFRTAKRGKNDGTNDNDESEDDNDVSEDSNIRHSA